MAFERAGVAVDIVFQVKTAEGMQERKVRVVALKDGKALVTVPELRDGDALAL